MGSPLPPGLQPEPILQAAPARNRRLSILLALNVYGLLAGALCFWVMAIRDGAARPQDKERLTIPITLEEETTLATLAPVTRPPGDTGLSGAPEGTGSIDPSLLQREEVLPMAPRTMEIQELPDPLTPPAKTAVDLRLPVAVGGTGLAHGQGHGRVAGKGSGRALIRGVPGLNPELDLADLEVIHEEIPQYPLLAEWGRIQGDVVVRVTINEKGVPIKTELQEGPPALQAETMRAVKLWRFGRGIFRGRKMQATFDMTFRYILRGP